MLATLTEVVKEKVGDPEKITGRNRTRVFLRQRLRIERHLGGFVRLMPRVVPGIRAADSDTRPGTDASP